MVGTRDCRDKNLMKSNRIEGKKSQGRGRFQRVGRERKDGEKLLKLSEGQYRNSIFVSTKVK